MGHTRPVEQREPSHLRAVGAEPETATAGRATVGDGEALVQELVGRARSGDMQAWARLYQDHFDGLFRHLRYLTGCPQLAEELVQESFVQALCCIGKYDGRSRFSTWLHGIGLNVARHRADRTNIVSIAAWLGSPRPKRTPTGVFFTTDVLVAPGQFA